MKRALTAGDRNIVIVTVFLVGFISQALSGEVFATSRVNNPPEGAKAHAAPQEAFVISVSPANDVALVVWEEVAPKEVTLTIISSVEGRRGSLIFRNDGKKDAPDLEFAKTSDFQKGDEIFLMWRSMGETGFVQEILDWTACGMYMKSSMTMMGGMMPEGMLLWRASVIEITEGSVKLNLTAKQARKTFALTEETPITKAGKKITPAELVPGEKVYVILKEGKVLGMSDRCNFLGVYAGPDTVNSGCVVLEVLPDSPAAKAGIMEGDLVVTVNDKAVSDRTTFNTETGNHSIKKFKLAVMRDKKKMEITIDR